MASAPSAPFPESALADATRLYRAGGVLAYPTDTVYGLGGNPLDETVISAVYHLKDREPTMGLPVLGRDLTALRKVARIPAEFEGFLEEFWPGGFTAIFEKRSGVPVALTGNRDSVAVRVPAHEPLRDFLDRVGGLIIGTSANKSGHPECLTAAEVRQQFGDELEVVLPGPCGGERVSSTIVRLNFTPRRYHGDPDALDLFLIREGQVSWSRVKAALLALME